MLVTKAVISFAAVLAATSLANANALDMERPAYLQPVQFFNDLPGVAPQEPLNAPNNVVCEQIIEKHKGEPTKGRRYNILNSCTYNGGPAFQSPRLPLSFDRQRRGLGY